ncbi:MAG: hypothetical protein RL318_2278 [Fibrobacterota bacterium]|jgi:uncharacterized protein
MEWYGNESMWEGRFITFLEGASADAAHDLGHVRRVVHAARALAALEGARLDVVLPAAWLHDCVAVSKDSPLRAQASRLAADRAVGFLREGGFPEGLLEAIGHCIHAHSFSAKVEPVTIEAKVVQDADRLEALGAIGLWRCIATGEAMRRPFLHPDDPFWEHRDPDDAAYGLDHLPVKLLTLAGTMRTEAGRAEAVRRTGFLEIFLAQLRSELPGR